MAAVKKSRFSSLFSSRDKSKSAVSTIVEISSQNDVQDDVQDDVQSLRVLESFSPPPAPTRPAPSMPQVKPAKQLPSTLKPRPSDVFIAVMGMTGVGKSTFVSLCTEDEVKLGHGLGSCKH